MNFKLVINILSILLFIICLFMLVPLMIAVGYHESDAVFGFGVTIILSLFAALLVYLITRKTKRSRFSTRDGFLMVSLGWMTASAIGALPFFISHAIPSYTDAYFETMSGFTTTGASILTEIESLPHSILFWRSLTHWLGGMGIVVLTVAVLPLLGVSGINLMKAEAPGPSIDKISSKIASTAKILWGLYIGFTIIETVLLMFGGMTLFESLIHSFGTMATGGFSSKNLSVGAYSSPYIHWVITVFMIIAGLNFALYFRLITGKFKDVFKNNELQLYFAILILATLFITFKLFVSGVYGSVGESLQFASFQVASVMTTTGYATTDYSQWPEFTKAVLYSLMFVGGCAGSTGGGIKVVRLVALYKLVVYELKKLLYPQGVFSIRMNGEVVSHRSIYSIAGFFFVYIFFLLFTTLFVAFFGSNILTSFTTALATVGNIGPGFGSVGPASNYHAFALPVKWFLSFAMMVGRLEVYTVLVLFLPRFWSK